jgi:hypothetical protein
VDQVIRSPLWTRRRIGRSRRPLKALPATGRNNDGSQGRQDAPDPGPHAAGTETTLKTFTGGEAQSRP